MDPHQLPNSPTVTEKAAPLKYGDEELSDVVIVVDEQEFHVHRMILASRSEYFKAMFYRDFKEANEDHIEIKEVSVVAFKKLVDFWYKGCITDCDKFLRVSKIMLKETFKIKSNFVPDGVRVFRHETSINKTKYVENFWKSTGELLNVADRFNVTSDVKQYLQQIINSDICSVENCFCCLNQWIFAMVHKMDVDQEEKHYKYCMFKEWLSIIDEKDIAPLESIDFTILGKLFKKFESEGVFS